MAADEVKVTGIEDLRTALLSIPAKLRKKALRNALAAGARIVRDAARAKAPVLKQATPYRTPGTIRRALAVRTSKADRKDGNVGVFVNVRPAKKAARGAKSPTDPFYWRFVNFGTKKMAGVDFLRAGAAKLGEALKAFEKSIGPQIQKLNSNPKDPL